MPKIDGRKDTRPEFEPGDLLFEYVSMVTGSKSIGRCVIKGCGLVLRGGDLAARVVPAANWTPGAKAVGWVCEEHFRQMQDTWSAGQETEPPF